MLLLLLGAEEKVAAVEAAPAVILPQENKPQEAVTQDVARREEAFSQEDQKLEAWNQEGARQEAIQHAAVVLVQNQLMDQAKVHTPVFNQNFVQDAREAIAEEEKYPDNLQEAQLKEVPDEKHEVIHVPEQHVVKHVQQKAISQQEVAPKKELVKEEPPKNCSSGNVAGPVTINLFIQSSSSTNNVMGPITIHVNFQSSGH